MNYIINLFGTGIRYWICNIPLDEFEEMNKIRQNHKVEWENLLFDFDFLKHFGYNHWSELSSYPEQIGFLLLPENRIEIKCGSKFITRFRAHELSNDETLFPLYNTVLMPLTDTQTKETKSLILIQYEKGLIAKYKFETLELSIAHLNFHLSLLNNNQFIAEIQFQNKKLSNLHEDSVIVATKVIQKLNNTLNKLI